MQDEYTQAINNSLSVGYIANIVLLALGDYVSITSYKTANLVSTDQTKENVLNEITIMLKNASISKAAKENILKAVESYYDSVSSLDSLSSPYAQILSSSEQLKSTVILIKLQESQNDAFAAAKLYI